jgi:peptide/nickel transport system permease protein
MLGFILRRVLATIPVMGVVATFVFLLLHIGPSDPAAVIAGDYASPETIMQIREKLNPNRPLTEQLLTWFGSILRGDLGISIYSDRPVSDLILQRAEPTIALTISTMLFSVSFAVPMGILAAYYVGTWVDRAVMTLAVVSFSIPVFVIGYTLVLGFSLELPWLPVQGYRSLTEGVGSFLRHLALPTISLGVVYIALVARITRASMLEVLSADYIRTARANGLSEFVIVTAHALKNAAVPIVTIIGMGFALLISGVVVTESVFGIPGLGRLTADAVLHRDYPVIQGLILVFSAAYVMINLTVDIIYTLVDPRIRY